MLLIVIGDIVLDGDSLARAREEAQSLETFRRWSLSDPFNPYRVDGLTFRNVSDWKAHNASERVRVYLCLAAGVPYK